MVVGRMITSSGAESITLICSFLIKNYVEEKYYILMNCSLVLLSRALYATLYAGFPAVYAATQSLEIVNMIPVASILFSLLCFSFLYSKVKDLDTAVEKSDTEGISFSDLKQLDIKYYSLVAISVTMLSSYWTFSFMLMQFLEGRAGLAYLDAKNVYAMTPMSQLATTAVNMTISLFYVNEVFFMTVCMFLQLGIFVGVPNYDGTGVYLGMAVCITQGIIGSTFSSNFYSALSKAVPKKIGPIGVALSETVTNIARFTAIWVSGKIIGEKANVEKINEVMGNLKYFTMTAIFFGLLNLSGVLMYFTSKKEEPKKIDEDKKTK